MNEIDQHIADILVYESTLTEGDRSICETLRHEIEKILPDATSKVWHAHPVWFLSGNPIVGYSKRRAGITLLFWSGQSFEEENLKKEGSFQAAEKVYGEVGNIDLTDLARWLAKSRDIQWDYANIVKRKGKLERLK